MTSDSLANSQLVPDAAAFLDDLLPVEKLSPLEEPTISPSELLDFEAVAFPSDLLPENKTLSPEGSVAMSSKPGTPNPEGFLSLGNLLPPENIFAPQGEFTAPDATAPSPDMLPRVKPLSPEELLILSSEPITSGSADFLSAGEPLPPEEHAASPSEVSALDATAFLGNVLAVGRPSPPEESVASPGEPPVPDASAFLGDILSMDAPPTQDGLLAPSKALSIQRELDNDSAPRLGERAGSVVGQGILVSNLRLFVRFDQASEVSEMTRIFRLPGTPKWVCGLANLHGNLVPVLDIASFFNLPNEASEKTMLLVLGHEENALAVTVNGIPERLRFNENDRIPAPLIGEYLQPYVPGAFARGNDIWLELEHEKLLKTLAISLAS